MAIDYLNTPIGELEIRASEQGIIKVIFIDSDKNTINQNEHTNKAKSQLSEYFNNQRQDFDLKIDSSIKGTEFQHSIWKSLLTVAFGKTATYRDMATLVNNPKAVRAVGAANGKNPIAIIVPCHRIIGMNGTLTGYAGGLERKKWLLEHEAVELN